MSVRYCTHAFKMPSKMPVGRCAVAPLPRPRVAHPCPAPPQGSYGWDPTAHGVHGWPSTTPGAPPPLGAWAGPCAAVTWNFTYKTDGAGKAVFRQKRKKRSLAEKPPKTLTLHTKYMMPTGPYKEQGA